ncbi:hypothetical protein EDB19DRAFT_869325 [Suillus lakei]|nr:hypothetical protein EDB19DRAFT_869325 [Suillus lakei]
MPCYIVVVFYSAPTSAFSKDCHVTAGPFNANFFAILCAASLYFFGGCYATTMVPLLISSLHTSCYLQVAAGIFMINSWNGLSLSSCLYMSTSATKFSNHIASPLMCSLAHCHTFGIQLAYSLCR